MCPTHVDFNSRLRSLVSDLMNFTSSHDPGAPRERGRITMADAQPWLMRGRTKAFGIVIVAVLIWMFLRVSPPVPIASWGGVV